MLHIAFAHPTLLVGFPPHSDTVVFHMDRLVKVDTQHHIEEHMQAACHRDLHIVDIVAALRKDSVLAEQKLWLRLAQALVHDLRMVFDWNKRKSSHRQTK